MSARPGSENAESVVLVVKGDPLDEAGQQLLRSWLQFRFRHGQLLSLAASVRDSRGQWDSVEESSDKSPQVFAAAPGRRSSAVTKFGGAIASSSRGSLRRSQS